MFARRRGTEWPCDTALLDSDVIAGTVNRSIMERMLVLWHSSRPTELQKAYPWSVSNCTEDVYSVIQRVQIVLSEALSICWTPQD